MGCFLSASCWKETNLLWQKEKAGRYKDDDDDDVVQDCVDDVVFQGVADNVDVADEVMLTIQL